MCRLWKIFSGSIETVFKAKRGQAMVEFTICLVFLLLPCLIIVFQFPEVTHMKMKTQEAARLLWEADETHVRDWVFPGQENAVGFDNATRTYVTILPTITELRPVPRPWPFQNVAASPFDVEPWTIEMELPFSKIPFLDIDLNQGIRYLQPLHFTAAQVSYDYGVMRLLPGTPGVNINIGTSYPVDRLNQINKVSFVPAVVGKYYINLLLDELKDGINLMDILKF
jgi:hypothetical protein